MDNYLPRRRRINLAVICSVPLALFVAGNLRAYELTQLEPGHWYEVPNSSLRAAAPDPLPPGNIEGVISAWSGGALDTKRDKLLVWGGGHADYAGNEIYAFDLNSLRWTRLTEPSLNVGGDPDSGVYPDGKPRSRHTYDYIEYLPDQDLFCSFGGSALYPSGNSTTSRTDCYDFRTSAWTQRASVPALGGNKLESVAAYDYASGKLFYKPKFSSGVGRYDPSTDTWEELGTDFYLSGKRTAAIDSESGIMVIVGEGETGYLNLGSGQYEKISTSGSGPSSRAPGLAYDRMTKRIIAWEGGANVYSLDTEARVWRTHVPATSNSVTPPDQSNWGTFGRFRYVPSKNLFVVVSGIDQNVFVYKLSAGEGNVEDKAQPKPPSAFTTEGDAS